MNRIWIGFAGVCLALTQAHAQNVRWGLEPGAASYFEEGTWAMDLAGGYVKDWDRGDSQMVLTGLGLSYYLRNTLALRAELVGYGIDQKQQDAVAIGGDLGLRQHWFNHENWSIFAEAIVGVVEANHPVPEGGTFFNFHEAVGLGATYRIAQRTHLIGGVRYFHLSNARIEGDDRNPTINGWEGYVGVMWEF